MEKTNLETKWTKLVPKDIKFNSPTEYYVVSKVTGETLQTINIQKGPVLENDLNGIFIEDLILISINQLEHFQDSPYACKENEATLRHLYDALATTRSRQYERSIRGVQGKSIK